MVKVREKYEHNDPDPDNETKSETNESFMPISIETLCKFDKSGWDVFHFKDTIVEVEDVVVQEHVEFDGVVTKDDKELLSRTIYIRGVYGYEANLADPQHALPIAHQLQFRIRLT